MNTSALWEKLRTMYPDRTHRVAAKCLPLPEDSQTFLNQLKENKSIASISDDKCGWVGNPFEQVAEDFSVLLSAAEEITGQKGSYRWATG